MPIASINPTTGQMIQQFEPLSDWDLDERICCAHESFEHYRHSTFSARARWLTNVADILDCEQERLAHLAVSEMGKPVKGARQEIAKCALTCRYYADHGEQFLRDEHIPMGTHQALVRCQPLGPILAIMPWNFPFWQVIRFAAPTLMAGNVALLKHASNVSGCALALEGLFKEAGFPDGVFQTLLIESGRVARVIADDRVCAVTLTGSSAAGRSVAAVAGKYLKKTVLELGGSDPFLVMPSANLEEAVGAAVQSRIINNGQSCIAAKRFIAVGSIGEQFEERFAEGMRALRVGDPLDTGTDVGPLASEEALTLLDTQVRTTIQLGGRCLTGGHRLTLPGYFYAPTVLVDIPPAAPACHDEVFGPVAAILRASDLKEAIRLANSTPFGLAASVWTQDAKEVATLVSEIEAGMVFVNGMVVSDPRIPFGGIKESGYGRELGALGIREFVNIKTVVTLGGPPT